MCCDPVIVTANSVHRHQLIHPLRICKFRHCLTIRLQRHAGSTSDVALVEEHYLRGLAIYVSKKMAFVSPVRRWQQMYVPTN